MDNLSQYHQPLAVLIARIFLGFLFLFQGYDAVFKIKIRTVIQTYQNTFTDKGIPRIFIVCGAWYTSLSELIGGALLIVGFFETYALILLGLNLIIATIAFGITTPMWDTRHVFPRLIILIFLLAVPDSWQIFSLDNFFFK